MNSKKEMKYFSAVTYDNFVYHFAVTPEGEIYCIEFGIEYPADKIEINPSFVLRDEGYRTVYSLETYFRDNNRKKTPESLICKWNIPKDVLEYLYENDKIKYSTIIGLAYGFKIEKATDRCYQTRLIRIAEEKPEQLTRILAPYKSGRFH